MDEEDTNYLDVNSPKGALIKLLEAKCKKPDLENDFQEILEKYQLITEEQKAYLQSGLININFAEEALFVQSCSILYGKRVDKLYDEVLAYQLRLVQYDDKHAKETNNSGSKQKRDERKAELKKLENRLNKSKRKKIKLVQDDNDCDEESEEQSTSGNKQRLTNFLINDLEEDNPEKHQAFAHNKVVTSHWNSLEEQLHNKSPRVVWEYSNQSYQLDNYQTHGDHDIYDINDSQEYIIKYSKAPSYHSIKHLFEYNDSGLLPDSAEVIEKLRLAFSLTKKFLKENKISTEAAINTFKDEYYSFCKSRYFEEKKRFQNIPQSDLKELRSFYEVLINKEHEIRRIMKKQCSKRALKDIESATFDNIINNYLINDINTDNNVSPNMFLRKGIFDLDSSSEPEESCAADDRDTEVEEVANAKLIPGDEPKVRSDSGYFESGFETDEGGDGAAEADASSVAETLNATEFSVGGGLEGSNGNLGTSINDLSVLGGDKSVEDEVDSDTNNNKTVVANSTVATSTLTKMITRQIVFKVPVMRVPVKRTNKLIDIHEDPSKRRKLSQKQVEKLQKSVVKPVNALKWESFCSMNYQAQTGEGIVCPFYYESDESDIDEEIGGDGAEVPIVDECHSDSEESHVSDHTYCRPDSVLDMASISEKRLSQDSERHDSGIEVNTESEYNLSIVDRDHMYTPIPGSRSCSPTLAPSTQTEQSVQYCEERESRKRIEAWKVHIQQKLKHVNPHRFDIHEYGSHIISSLEKDETRNFKEYVKGQSKTEAIRFFVTSLHLATTNNIAMSGVQSNKLSNDTLEIKLLDTERYHERLDQYQAPSEESLQGKLEKARKLKKHKHGNTKHGRLTQLSDGGESSNVCRTYSKNTSPTKRMRLLSKSEGNVRQSSVSRNCNIDLDLQPNASWDSDMDDVQPLASTSFSSNNNNSYTSVVCPPMSYSPEESGRYTGVSLDEFSFFSDLENLQENSTVPLRSTPRSMKDT